MATVTELKGFPRAAGKGEILGEIVSWYLSPGAKVKHSHLVEALNESGLDGSAARAFLPRNAFTRAARALAERRIIRRVDEDLARVRFQFTREDNAGDELAYTKEAVLSLDKETGAIACDDDPALAARARDAFDEAMQARTTGDVTAIVQRLFVDKANPGLDLVPIRRQGGAYFVRREAFDFLDKVGAFLDRLHGEFTRLPVAAGYGTGERVVSVSVAEKIGGLIAELDERVAEFDPDPEKQSARAIANAGERVKLIKHKVASYAEYLQDERGRLDDAIKAAVARLQAKVFGVSEDAMHGADAITEPAPAD